VSNDDNFFSAFFDGLSQRNAYRTWRENNCGIWHVNDQCTPGAVYVAAIGAGRYKIGCTAGSQGLMSIVVRLDATFGKGRARFVHGVKTSCHYGLERRLHERFKPVRVAGEIFELSERQLNYIMTLRSFKGDPVTHIDAQWFFDETGRR
jgi:hypothetical protein